MKVIMQGYKDVHKCVFNKYQTQQLIYVFSFLWISSRMLTNILIIFLNFLIAQ